MFEQGKCLLLKPPSYQEVRLSDHHLPIVVKRLDQIHPHVNGNKWYKLKYNLEKALLLHRPTILSFGGLHSNHIYALAAAGNELGIKTIGIIRGEERNSSTLDFARSKGMELHYVSRTDYKNKYLDISMNQLQERFGEFHMVPEGASNEEGVIGCEEILEEYDLSFDVICLASGTGSTLAGILRSASNQQNILAFSALKGGSFLRDEALKFKHEEKEFPKFDIITDYHFGGYARWNEELLSFIRKLEHTFQLPLDQVYTGKMIYGVKALMAKGIIKPDQKVLCIHTGGLQGRLPELTSF